MSSVVSGIVTSIGKEAISAAKTVVGVGASLLGASATRGAAKDAAASQERQTQLGIDEQRRQFDKLQELLSPYVGAGEEGLQGQLGILGLGGPGAAQAEIDRISGGAEFAEIVRQGEGAILQNASATGGLRGGNVQRALAEFRPGILSSLLDKQYARYGDLAFQGQASAAGVGAGATRFGESVARGYGNIGDAQAQAALAGGRANANLYGDIAQAGGSFLGSLNQSKQPSFADVAARVKEF